MTYQRITNFPENALEMGSQELMALGSVWKEKKAELELTGVFQEFIKKMQREWAIETGIIERLYVWDRGVTEVLIEQGIDSSIIAHKGGITKDEADRVNDIIKDQLDIVEGLFGFVKGEQPLTEHFIRNLQAQFTNHQEYTDALTQEGIKVRIKLTKGAYKEQPNNPKRPDGETHEYCLPEFTKDEMEKLIQWYRDGETKYPVEVRASWLHHRFTQIHPFQDGNGRVARALASLVFLKEGLFPLVVRDSDRVEYIGALETADKGDLLPLTQFFTRRQRESILRALGLEQQVQQAKYADQIITSALEVLKDKYSKEKEKAGKVYDYAAELFTKAETSIKNISKRLDAELRKVTPPGVAQRYHAHVSTSNNSQDKKHYFYSQIIEMAKEFGYVASLDRHHSWVKMVVSTDEIFEFIISIHGYGIGENGILAVSAFTAQRIQQEEGGTAVVNTHPSSTDLFQFNYIESIESTKARFDEWLQSSLAIGLAEWKRRLVV